METKVEAGQDKIEKEMEKKMEKEAEEEKERAEVEKIEEEIRDTRRCDRLRLRSELPVPTRVAHQGPGAR